MRFYWLFLGILSTWRLTHLLVAEDGPWNLIARLRALAGAGLWKSLLDCFYCLSLWVSFPLALLIAEDGVKEVIFLWLGLSTGAIALERISAISRPPPALYFEDDKQEEVLPSTDPGTGQNEDQKASMSAVDSTTASSALEQASSPPQDYDASIVIVQSENGRFRLH